MTNLNTKRAKLEQFALSVIDNPLHQPELQYLFNQLNISKQLAVKEYVDYDMDIFAYGNEIYESPNIRIVLHIHNYLEGSWHPVRHETILKFIEKISPKTIADIGFGVPSRYVKDYILKDQKHKAFLYDINQPAFDFAEKLLPYWNNNWQKNIELKWTDMDQLSYVGDADLYLFQDAIEHTKYPEQYVKKLVTLSPLHAKFIFSMPIGELIPMHYIAWASIDEAINWLDKCGLMITDKKIISVNPEVDLFSDSLSDFSNLVVICSKK